MNKREQQIRSARQLISDEQLIAFLHAAGEMKDCDVYGFEEIREALDEGKSLDEVFYDGNDSGYMLSVDQISGSNFRITFGILAPLAGGGGEWQVSFAGDKVRSISGGMTWIS